MKYKFKNIFLVTALICFCIIVAGCNRQSQKMLPGNQITPPDNTTRFNAPNTNSILNNTTQPNGGQSLSGTISGMIPGAGTNRNTTSGTNTTQGTQTSYSSDTERANRIIQAISQLPNIKRAGAIVNGNRCAVGVQLNDNSNKGLYNAYNAIRTQLSNITGTTGTAGSTTGTTGSATGTTVRNGATGTGGTGITGTGGTTGAGSSGTGTTGGNGMTGTTGNQTSVTQASDQKTIANGLKTLIAQRVRSIDPALTDTSVTTDNALVTRMDNHNKRTNTEANDVITRIKNLNSR